MSIARMSSLVSLFHVPGLPRLVSVLVLGVFPALGAVDFAKDIEPILIRRCSECHGPDKQKGDLRLDTRAAALKAGESGKTALVPRKPDHSELFLRVTSTDPDEVMPSKGARLTEAEVAILRQWIADGAVWPEFDASRHWSFTKVQRPAIPPVTEASWPRNDVDRFILARLEQEGLKPQVEADRTTLIRRLTFDLTGLPPTWSDVSAFLADTSTNAYEKVVDRLLASPQYGEHMARGWLDLARYADSNGYQVDLARSIWPYREWVINAFNRNQPFDQFTIEQLAGDLLPNATLEQKIATGFNRNTKINDEGGGDDEEYRTKAVKDRVATVGTTWMGLTLMCAECHTHKYDPITHDEYYQLYAFFNSSADAGNYSLAPVVDVPPPDLKRPLQELRERIQATRSELSQAEQQLPAEQAAWEQRLRAAAASWQVLSLTNLLSSGGSGYTNLADGSVLAVGVNPIYDTITFESDAPEQGITAVMLEVMPDPSLPKNGPGRWGQTGNFILDEFALAARPAGGSEPFTNVFFAGAVADWEQQYYRAEHAVDRNPKTGWAIGPKFGQPHFLIAELNQTQALAKGDRLQFKFDHYHGNSHTIGRFRVSVTTEKDPLLRWPVPAEVAAAVRLPAKDRSRAQADLVASYYRSVDPEVRRLERELYRLNQRETELASRKYTTPIMQERAEARPTYVHVRGNFLEKGKSVEPGVPAVFPSLPAGVKPNRLALARWLVDPAHPLTARVTVNRYWERLFGTGLVKTSDDFGRQGEVPVNGPLLDWLASEFVASGWDIKAMQKLLVMSATYRQSAVTDPVRQEKDFYNRLLARGPRFRLDAEMIRDQALAVSGLLNPEVGGPSVYPIQVPNLWKEIGFLRPEIGMDEWPVSEGSDLYRRSVYTFWRRVCTYPTLATFDAPSRDVCVARRPRTNTPLQALAGLNEPTLLEAARVFAQRVLTEGGTDPAQQLDYAFRTSLGRRPTAAEQKRLLEFLNQQLASYTLDAAAAKQLVDVGSAARPAQLDVRSLAAWMMVANVLFNLDESLTKG
ncbi:MAG: DUF1553 domain-containing protein [Verrucomicrobia bacterium]|nr:DUF1553 domain-containing protein [Verrucomicrobiota bacterium]